jgi:hypothetical protein
MERRMSGRKSKGITHLKSARSGVVARHPDGLVTSAGKLDDGRWLCMAVTATNCGAFAVGDTHTPAVARVCDELGLSKARIIGGRYANSATETEGSGETSSETPGGVGSVHRGVLLT